MPSQAAMNNLHADFRLLRGPELAIECVDKKTNARRFKASLENVMTSENTATLRWLSAVVRWLNYLADVVVAEIDFSSVGRKVCTWRHGRGEKWSEELGT